MAGEAVSATATATGSGRCPFGCKPPTRLDNAAATLRPALAARWAFSAEVSPNHRRRRESVTFAGSGASFHQSSNMLILQSWL